MMKRQQYNQTWEELPQCVQRYLQRVAPEPLPNLKSLSYQQRGEVSLWDGWWDNFTSSGLITAGGLALSGIVKINSYFDYHYSDVCVEGQGIVLAINPAYQEFFMHKTLNLDLPVSFIYYATGSLQKERIEMPKISTRLRGVIGC